MSMVPTPTPVFYEANGAPLQNGYIYIGTADMDPIANPIQVYWDEALTITATQPIRTLGGYPLYQGKPARLFVAAGSYSITVKNKSLITIISQATVNWSFITVSDFASTVGGMIADNVTINVPADYSTIAAAFAYVATKTITRGAVVTIKVADGT
ncbi:phage head-binding domain-containing protein, partial [bacterium]|nr:phage head-binding domain-containing protein [bacterium]